MNTGYIATDENMQSHGVKLALNEWRDWPGAVVPGKSGFVLFKYQSGAYQTPGIKPSLVNKSRVFKCEGDSVVGDSYGDGTFACRTFGRIRLLEEVQLEDCQWNVGSDNTNWGNTGDRNTGIGNVGCFNAGSHNAGSRNTAYGNVGSFNSGSHNVGSSNTGHYNSGLANSGDGNATSHSSGFFCVNEPKVMCFDVQTDMTTDEFKRKHKNWAWLCHLLTKPDEIPFDQFKDLPGITPAKLKRLHEMHLSIRMKSIGDASQ